MEEYVPAGQSVGAGVGAGVGLGVGLGVGAGVTTIGHEVLPAPDVKPAGHARHSAAASTLEYVPAGHGWHVPGPAAAPTAPEYVPAGHAWHSLMSAAPSASEYAPAGHLAHPATVIL